MNSKFPSGGPLGPKFRQKFKKFKNFENFKIFKTLFLSPALHPLLWALASNSEKFKISAQRPPVERFSIFTQFGPGPGAPIVCAPIPFSNVFWAFSRVFPRWWLGFSAPSSGGVVIIPAAGVIMPAGWGNYPDQAVGGMPTHGAHRAGQRGERAVDVVFVQPSLLASSSTKE